MKPKHVKKLLITEIKRIADNHRDYCTNPKSDFTCNRKLPFERLLAGIIGIGGGSGAVLYIVCAVVMPDEPDYIDYTYYDKDKDNKNQN